MEVVLVSSSGSLLDDISYPGLAVLNTQPHNSLPTGISV